MPGVMNFAASEYSEEIRENACWRETELLRLMLPISKESVLHTLQCNLATVSHSHKSHERRLKLQHFILTANQWPCVI